jgi:hypothetical protein
VRVLRNRFAPILIGVAIIAACAGAWWYAYSGHARYVSDDPAYNKAYWRHEIEDRGAAAAYKEFLEKTEGGSYSWTHFSAHAVGEILFETQGIGAIAICDDSFDYGCYHGFSSRAIALEGKEALLKINGICTELGDVVSACKHGLGHGVLEYMGPQNLNAALEMCETLVHQDGRLSGCLNGVFMQYLTPSEQILGTATEAPRHLDSEHPYAPCTDVGAEFQSFCYFELGQWFRRTEGVDYGALCGALQGEAAQNCFLGVGADLTRGWKDVNTLKTKCARYSEDNELSCRAGAAWAFAYNGRKTALCSYEDPEKENACVREADFTDGLDPSIEALLR